MKKIFVAATVQNAGKTTVSLGLYRAAQRKGYTPCFIKPVGQRYQIEDGEKVDEDAVLFKHALSAKGLPKDLNPVSIPRGFTRDYIFNRKKQSLISHIEEAFSTLAEGCDVAIIEGTGHAGVGSVVDVSNAQVARRLNASCVIVSGGGIGSCIDEICLNRALFEEKDVPILGAIINKVYEKKYQSVAPAVRQGLKNQGIRCLGVIPYRKELAAPTMRQFKDELELEVLTGEQQLENRVENMVVAAMSPQNMIKYLKHGSLVIVPGDRIDNILASVNSHLLRKKGQAPRISGMLLTGGFVPPEGVRKMMREAGVPVLLTDKDTASAAFEARSMVAKIREEDKDKIQMAEELVGGWSGWVDIERLFDNAPDVEA